MNILDPMMNAGQFMLHGGYFLWIVNLMARHATANVFIGLAYSLILFTLIYFVSERKDLRFRGKFVCFAVFIPTGGTKFQTIHQHR